MGQINTGTISHQLKTMSRRMTHMNEKLDLLVQFIEKTNKETSYEKVDDLCKEYDSKMKSLKELDNATR